MRRLKYSLYLLATLLLLSRCTEKDLNRYENDPGLYFHKSVYTDKVDIQNDSISHSFFSLPDDQMRDTAWVDIRTIGLPADYPRPVKIVQTNIGEKDAAIPGKHYVAFDDESIRESMVVAPGNMRQMLPVILLRDPSLNSERVRIEMRIEENEYFKVGIDTLSRFMVSTTAEPQKPAIWDSYWLYTFGKWGARKMWLIMRYTGFDEFEQRPSENALAQYLKGMATEALEKYNADENNPDRPLKEADGTIVEF